MTRLVRAAPPGLTAAAEAWLGHRTDLLEAGEEPPPWLQPQLCAALRASNERALVQRVLIAAGPTALRESLEAVAVPWLLARGDASSVLTTIIAARKSKKGRKVPTKGLESALISVHAHAERGRPRPAGAPWSAWGTVEKVEPACERAVTSIQLWGTRRWVTRAGAAAQLEVLGEAERWLLDDDEAVSVRDDDGPGVRIAPGDGFHTVCALPARRVLTLSAAHTMAHGVQLWNADSGAALQHAPIDDMPLALVAAGLERVLIVGADSVWLWPIGQKKALRWRAPQGAAWAAIGSDHVAVGCEDRTLHFLRWSNDKLKAEAAYGDGWAIPGMAGSPEGRFLAQPDRDGVKVWADGALTGWLTWPESPDPGRAEVPDADGWVVVVGETAVLGRGRRVEAWSMGDRVRHATWEAPHELTARAVDRNGVWLGDAKGAVWWLAPKP